MSVLKSFITILSHPQNEKRRLHALSVIVWWKINQLFFHIPAVIEIAPNVKIICYPNNSYGSFIVYAKWPEFAELQFIYTYLQSTDTFIDVGAHIGDSSLLAATKIRTGKILACEPTPLIFDELLSNIRLNNFESRIIPIRKANTNKVGHASFTLEPSSEVNHLQTSKGEGKSIKVSTITIDALAKEYNFTDISLLKVDVEGFELEVLEGCKKMFAQKKLQMILFEVNPSVTNIEEKVEKISKLLKHHDFSFFGFTGKAHVEKIDTLIVPSVTSNFLAVSQKESNSRRFKKWLK
ncbi:MAG: FkbM family methyltransferase [Candidatus Woesebacteria bacterium]